MSLQKLGKQIGRELKANRKKAGMLGVLALVAVWFWLPLLIKFDVKPAAAAAVAPAPTTPATAATSFTAIPPLPAMTWQEMVHWIEQDLRMQPARLATDTPLRNPFARVHELPDESEPADSKTSTNAEAQKDIDPADLGLILTSTIVGRNRRAATISGKVYDEGEEVPVSENVKFVVKQVQASTVLLSRRDKDYPLSIKKSADSRRMNVRSTVP